MNKAMNINNQVWVSAHLFYAEPWEQMLAASVKPFVEKLVEEKLIDQFFFIRYWEHGPHIRLRLKTDVSREVGVRTRLFPHCNRYFEEAPSDMRETNRKKDTDYPNNSVQFIDYEPET
jgi:thiopeptide-type bacteriocin biosynthesis protein